LANLVQPLVFEGKKAPTSKQDAKVKILLGAPGSGKSYNAAQDYFNQPKEEHDQTIYVSYDETGAIYAIPGFKKEIQAIIDHEFDEHGELDTSALPEAQCKAIGKVLEKYRPLSQHIRTEILIRAAAENYNMVIDTTSSSPGALKMIDSIENAGYSRENMEVEGTYAPLKKIKRTR
jgi:hypothetical protein